MPSKFIHTSLHINLPNLPFTNLISAKHIDGLYNGLIAINVGSPFVASIDIPFNIFSVVKDIGNGMATWYANYVPLPTATIHLFQVHSETLQPHSSLHTWYEQLNMLATCYMPTSPCTVSSLS